MFLCCELKWSTRDFDEIKIPFLNGFYSCQSFKDLDQKNFLANSLNHVQSPFPFRCSSDGEGDVKRLLQVPAKMHVTRISLIADKCSDFFFALMLLHMLLNVVEGFQHNVECFHQSILCYQHYVECFGALFAIMLNVYDTKRVKQRMKKSVEQ